MDKVVKSTFRGCNRLEKYFIVPLNSAIPAPRDVAGNRKHAIQKIYIADVLCLEKVFLNGFKDDKT